MTYFHTSLAKYHLVYHDRLFQEKARYYTNLVAQIQNDLDPQSQARKMDAFFLKRENVRKDKRPGRRIHIIQDSDARRGRAHRRVLLYLFLLDLQELQVPVKSR